MARTAPYLQRLALAGGLVALATLFVLIAPKANAQTQPSCVINGVTVETRASAGDCEALSALRSSIPSLGSIWTAADPCAWRGVECRRDGQGVKSLSILGRTAGTIPPEIGRFTTLQYLRLSSNDFSGTIPSEIGNLKSLEILEIGGEGRDSANGLTGSLPSSIGSLTNLTSLQVNRNKLSGPIPSELASLTKLTVLELRNSGFEGQIPALFDGMNRLQILDLSDNRLTGTIPSAISNLRQLESLRLNNNAFTGSLPEALGTNQANLKLLNLSYNELTGSIPGSVFSRNIRDLILSNNKLTGSIPLPESGVSSLSLLDLANNRFDGGMPAGLFASPILKTVDLSNNALSGEIAVPANIRASNLRELTLSNNELTGTIPTGVASLPRLQRLKIEKNKMSGVLPSTVTRLAELQLLPNGCFETNDPAVLSYLRTKGYRAPFGACGLPNAPWGLTEIYCATRTSQTARLTFQAANPTDNTIYPYMTLRSIPRDADGDVASLDQTDVKYLTLRPKSAGAVVFNTIRVGPIELTANNGGNEVFFFKRTFTCNDPDVTRPDVPVGEVGLKFSVSKECVGASARIEADLENTDPTSRDYEVAFKSTSAELATIRSGTIGAGAKDWVSAYLLTEGPLIVEVTTGGKTLTPAYLTVDCSSKLNASAPGNASASCMKEPDGSILGRIDVGFRNATNSRGRFSVKIADKVSRVKTLSANELWQVVIPSNPNGDYVVEIYNGSALVSGPTTVNVNCDSNDTTPAPDTSSIYVRSSCLAGNPRADVYIVNNSDQPVTYTASYGDGDVKSRRIRSQEAGRITLISTGAGVESVIVAANGVTALEEDITDPCARR